MQIDYHENFKRAQERLDKARDAMGAAESEYILAQRAYNDASRDMMRIVYEPGPRESGSRSSAVREDREPK